MKKTLFAFIAFLVAIHMTSCDNDDITKASTSPVFSKLTLSPSLTTTGDTVTAHVGYQSQGKNIYSNTYQLTITNNSNLINSVSYTWDEVDPTKKEPEYRFAAPDSAGTYTVSFRATFIRYSTHGPNGELYGSANSLSSTLTVR